MTSERATCVVVGGGPAGMVLGLLLARAGVSVQASRYTLLSRFGTTFHGTGPASPCSAARP